MSMIPQTPHMVKGLDAVADAFSGTVASDIVNVKNYNHATFLLHKAVGATGTSTVTVEACDDVSASNSTAIPFRYRKQTGNDDVWGAWTEATTSGFATTAGSSQLYEIAVDCQELGDTGYKYVRLKCVEVVDNPVLGGILIFLHGNRYEQAVVDSAIV